MAMQIFYPYPEPLEEGKARHLQAWRTATALAVAHEVTMAVADRCEFSGWPDKFQLVLWPRFLCLGPIRISLQRRFIARCLQHLASLPEQAVIYVRHLRLADALLEAQPRQKVIFEVHEFFSQNDQLDPERALLLQKMEGRVFVRSSGLVCITQGLVDALKARYLKLPPTAVIPDACDPAPFWRETSFVPGNGAKDSVDLIYAGSLHPWKGVETLIQAMAYLPERKLKVVGGSEEQVGRLRLLARRWRVLDRCEFLTSLPQREVWRHLRRARVGVAPNVPHAIGTEFTSPLKVFEYLAAGKPVLASDLPSLREVLDANVARFFPARSPRSLAVVAEKLLGDQVALERMSEQARRRSENFTWSKRAERITKFIETLPTIV